MLSNMRQKLGVAYIFMAVTESSTLTLDAPTEAPKMRNRPARCPRACM